MDTIEILTDTIGTYEDIMIVRILGSLDTVAAYTFHEKMKRLIEESGIFRYIIDLEKLEYISSAGIGIFPAIAPELQNNNGGIIFINVAEKTLKLFNMVGLTTIFGMCPILS